jgi:pyruvate dehydrogenase complex dehydrogenase (E1) component
MQDGLISAKQVADAIKKYGIDPKQSDASLPM